MCTSRSAVRMKMLRRVWLESEREVASRTRWSLLSGLFQASEMILSKSSTGRGSIEIIRVDVVSSLHRMLLCRFGIEVERVGLGCMVLIVVVV